MARTLFKHSRRFGPGGDHRPLAGLSLAIRYCRERCLLYPSLISGRDIAESDKIRKYVMAQRAVGNCFLQLNGGQPIGFACWISLATDKISGSSKRGATICNPTGKPSDVNPAGTEAAGCPVRLNGYVNGIHA